MEGDPTGSHCCAVSSGTVNGSSASTGPRQARVAADPETNSLLPVAYTATQVPDDRVTPPGSMLDCLFRCNEYCIVFSSYASMCNVHNLVIITPKKI